ncbi:MAG TPA: carbonic anhydrase [Microlunatus sp.]|nr:carbonic anhydrase [Microlunatus sp.]
MTEQREIVWRQALPGEARPARPSTAAEARLRLEDGNADFAKLGDLGGRQVISVGPEAFGLPPVEGAGLAQQPFVAVLACADARAPVELLFNQAGNAMFVVRVAGNVPGRECLGSLNYAVANLPTVKMITVLGHTSCGAVSAAVDALLSPQVYLDVIHDPSLRAIVDALLAGVRMADQALVDTYGRDIRQDSGFRDALIDLAVTANAAITAVVLARAVDCDVTYGVFSLNNRTVGVTGPNGWQAGLQDPPAGDRSLTEVLRWGAANAGL